MTDGNNEPTEVKIARLEEQIKASATALALSQHLGELAQIAARAWLVSLFSAVVAFLAVVVAFFKR